MIYGLRVTDDDYNTWVEIESTDEEHIEFMKNIWMEFDFVIDVMIEERPGLIVEKDYLDGIDDIHYM